MTGGELVLYIWAGLMGVIIVPLAGWAVWDFIEWPSQRRRREANRARQRAMAAQIIAASRARASEADR
jgi:peptidoglycan/LPS O-acetylase OafA/YrhL